ncbi:MAG TPA: DUF2058 family protein [Myxococcota bacterium]|nr:DUF2058 family protein [Myxococcota bacterium]
MSLRDALLKAGAVSKKRVKKTERGLKEKRRAEQGQRDKKKQIRARERQEAEAARAQREASMRSARAQRRDRTEKEARALRTRHLLEAHRIQVRTGKGTRFFFAHEGVVKRLIVPWTIARGLRAGVYAIALLERPYVDDEYVVIPAATAEYVEDEVLFRNLEPGDEGFTDDY